MSRQARKAERIMKEGISAELKYDEQDKGKLATQDVDSLIRVVLSPVVSLWTDVCYPYHLISSISFLTNC